MANLIRLCSSHSTDVLKPIFNWKFLSRVSRTPNAKRHDKWYYHFYKRKLMSNSEEPLSVYLKIGIGIMTGFSVKLMHGNSVFCAEKTKSNFMGTTTVEKDPVFNWNKFLILLSRYWLELIGAILAAMVCAALNIQIPRCLGQIIDIITNTPANKQNFWEGMRKPVIKAITYFSLHSIFTFIYIALLAQVGEGVAKSMKTAMFSSIIMQDIAFFDSKRTGELLNRLTIDIQDFKSSFKMIISQGLRNIAQVIGCSISIFFISPTMTGIMLIVVPAGIIGGTYVGAMLRKLSFKAKAQSAKVTLTAEEAISNIRTVRSFAMEDLESNILDEQAELCKKLNIKLGYGIAFFQAGSHFFLNGVVLGTIYLGGYMMTSGNISAGNLMAFLVSVQILQRSFTHLSLLFGLYIKGKHAGARVFEMIDLKPGNTLGEGKKIPYHSLIPNLEFKDVVFAYPSRPDKIVLKQINLAIPEGKTIAIVGSSGSGKSTLAWLIERFYDIEEGVLLIGEEDIRKLDSLWLRRNVIGFISQEPVLFATSVLENIRYGKPSATDEEVVYAAKLANADSFIREFPDGYHTMVGERGVSISGGQKQRIAIARALIKNPSILILDEATSALDAESERAVQQSLEAVTKSRTTIIIAHRLSTIKNADLIVVLHNGVIVESGSHRDLLNKNGMYAALVAQQVESS